MTNTGLVMSSDVAGATVASTRITPVVGTFCNVTSANESQFQIIIRNAGTYHGGWFRETGTTSSTLTFRKNTANGNQAITTTGTGTFQDSTHTDATIAADLVDWSNSGGSSLTGSILSMLFDSTTNFAVLQATTLSAGLSYTSGSEFTLMDGLLGSASSETGIKTRNQQACVMQNGQANLSSNPKTSAVTIQSRKNGANGNIAISSGTTAGLKEDTTHTDSLVGGDDWNYSFVNGTDTTNAQIYRFVGINYTTSSGNFFIVQAGADADISGTISSTQFAPIGGQFKFTATETNAQAAALAAFTFSNATTNMTQTSANTETYHFRKNTANGNQTFTFGTAAGVYTDSTHTDVCIATDSINSSFVFGGTTAGAFSQCQVWGFFASSVPYVQQPLLQWIET